MITNSDEIFTAVALVFDDYVANHDNCVGFIKKRTSTTESFTYTFQAEDHDIDGFAYRPFIDAADDIVYTITSQDSTCFETAVAVSEIA